MGSHRANYDAIVVGAGPGGLAAVSSLLDAEVQSILWIDKSFQGGRLNEFYREISSNTKIGIYLDALESSTTCRRIIENAPKPNAVTELEQMDREDTCRLAMAGDVLKLLIDGLKKRSEVEAAVGEVDEAHLDETEQVWKVRLSSGERHRTERLFLCTGSHPSSVSLHTRYNSSLVVLDLDHCLRQSDLPSVFEDWKDRQVTVAIIGNSHSGILVCRNLYELAESGKLDVRIFNFRRRPIKYAIYREDGIINDNSGLKGATADWAKETMDSDADPKSIIEQVDLIPDEDQVYKGYLPRCTHIVYAIGYEPNPIPQLFIGSERINDKLEFDMKTSGFRLTGFDQDKTERGLVRGLFGCGIAFPEEVADPEGNVEAAVGVAKFFKFTERVKGDWMAVR
ncbi:pyridine nucleotide-disulfide oxidoreductase-domain-containing protein [Kockovaella imperatae]|uniref:Pyridine nucleotide-disulfide oxidoreductase-domain-containing protein n=1 Tax=Kockovaella imperatae TaxID=4999 RepID=A0A1Y1UVI4_9TREE|nr:pyridine nucleotide-disulfide oxidoreductase-domain-containing protein [Kockovaella imperatae]ORX41235.1 pyridine nucleotide-disulfide oxidoreductase-domain-containing protein [Kockovaella imperatae]